MTARLPRGSDTLTPAIPRGLRTYGREPVRAARRRHGRGLPLRIPHRVRARIDLGGRAAKPLVYAESVRAAVTVALAAEESRHTGATVPLRELAPDH